MNEKKNIINLIKHVTSNDFKKANNDLANIVNEKLKQRIQAINSQLDSASKK